ncbi:hypothetical protein Scep_011200 [Stephania cephalantha]|uniref:Uncharacterized protein n=1 Tax=Stephania cephalantha TaxID=152367 RepID=A0AAP0JEX5_9MAGN
MAVSSSSSVGVLKDLVAEIKKQMLLMNSDIYSVVPPSAYDTAWLAMIPHPHLNTINDRKIRIKPSKN